MATIPRRVAILGGARIPFARANTAYADQGNLEMMSAAMKALVEKYALKGEKLGEVSAGAVIKHSRDWNLARESTQSAGLHPQTPAYDVQRACGTSLTTVATLASRIALGEIDSAIAGGSDSASDVPISYGRNLQRIVLKSARGRSLGERITPWLRLRPKDLKPSTPDVAEMRTGLSMGEHCELMAKEWGIGRAEQDELALASHRKAAEAWRGGFYSELVFPFRSLKSDNNIRPDASIEKLASLRPAFDRSGSGTLTAGNSTPLTDGAACVLLGSEEWARSRGIPVQDFDIYEIHEAFAAQVLCTLKAWESEEYCRTRLKRAQPLGPINRGKMNPKGGSVAVGHPFGATGARIVAGLAKQLADRGSGRGLISICTAGGMGVSAILER